MDADALLKPVLHVEATIESDNVSKAKLRNIGNEIATIIRDNYESVEVGQEVTCIDIMLEEPCHVRRVEVAAFTGRENSTGFYHLEDVELDVQAYKLCKSESPRSLGQTAEQDTSHARILSLPHVALYDEWNSLVFENGLPSRLLRYHVRMTNMMRQPGINLRTFNWNRLCLLHGPPGSGKSTLCRALAQKLSIRLGGLFSKSILFEINTNALLSKYFGESGKLIEGTFERIAAQAGDRDRLVCVVMDEIETIAGSREKSTHGQECNDGLRATNQLLTALDRVRDLPNVIILCTSNLVEAIDPAFLDRVDIKQLIPSPSAAAIYNIFRSCLNELIRSNLVDSTSASSTLNSSEPWTLAPAVPSIPSFSEMKVRLMGRSNSPGARVWTLAQRCQGFSGRKLRRLPAIGLVMYTGVGVCSLDDAVTALEAAVDQELVAMRGG